MLVELNACVSDKESVWAWCSGLLSLIFKPRSGWVLMSNRLCYIADMPHHYREPIFSLMASELGCDFYFGDKKNNIKHIDVGRFKGFRGWLSYLNLGSAHYLKGSLSAALRYDKVVLLGDPHGIHNWIICFVFKIIGRPVFLWTHGWYGKERGVKGLLKHLLFKLPSKIWVYGPRSRHLLVEKGFSESKIDVVYNSLNYNLMVDMLKRSECDLDCEKLFNNDFPVISYVGRVQKVKSLDMVLDAIAVLRGRGVGVNFLLVGELGEDGRFLETMVDTLQLKSQVVFFGPCYDELTLCSILKSSTLCVSPGNVGLTSIHSLTYGCPVLTHDSFDYQMPEFESILPGVTGDFFQYGDVEDLADKILIWASKNSSERESIRESCMREVARRWNPNAQIEIMANSIGAGL